MWTWVDVIRWNLTANRKRKKERKKDPTDEENLMPNLNLASSNGSKTDIMFGAKPGTFDRKLNDIFNPRTADVRGGKLRATDFSDRNVGNISEVQPI